MTLLAYTIGILIVVFARFGMAIRNCKDLGDAVAKGDLEGVKHLLKTCGANTYSWRENVLHRSVQLGRPDIVFVLLDRGADPHRVDTHRGGVTPLHLTVNSTHAADAVETVTHLLLRAVDRMARDDGDRIPLHYAARRGSLSAARLLLTACNPACRLAQLRARESHGRMRPADYAAAYGRTYMANWLRRVLRESNEAELMSMKNGLRDTYVKKVNCPDLLLKHSDLSQVRLSLRRCDIESQDQHKRTLLQYCCERGSLDVVFTLLVNGADVRRGHGTYDDETPLVFACHHGHRSEPVAMLLLHEPDRSFQDKFGDTALHYAARENFASWARMLLSNCNTACKHKLLRVFNNHHKMPVDMTPRADATVILWLKEMTREVAKIRLQEVKGKPAQSDGVAPPNDTPNRVQETTVLGYASRRILLNIADRMQHLEARVSNINGQLDRLLALKSANQSFPTSIPHTKLII